MMNSKYAKVAIGVAALVAVAGIAYAMGAMRAPSAPAPIPSPAPAPAPAPAPTPVTKGNCVIGGCSNEVCSDDSQGPAMSPCIYRPEFTCYKSAKCERQSDGQCGWTPSAALQACLKNPPPLQQ